MMQINLSNAKNIPLQLSEFRIKHDLCFNPSMHLGKKRMPVVRSENIGADVCGMIISKNNGLFGFNIQPLQYNNGYTRAFENITQKYEQLKAFGTELFGFICGGLNFKEHDKLAQSSYSLYNSIAEQFDKLQFPFGMICGKEDFDAQDNIRVFKDALYLWGNSLTDVESGNQQSIVSQLLESYNDILMPDNAELNVISEIK